MSSSPLAKPENMPAVKSPLYDEPSLEISAYSFEAAKHHILSSILSASSEGVCLRTPEHIFLRLERFLESLQEQGRVLRYVYDLDSSILKVMSVGSPIHTALAMSFSAMWQKYSAEYLYPNKLTSLLRNSIKLEKVKRDPVDRTVQRKIPARNKAPDLAIYFVKPTGKDLLTVVFEVGFTETYADLLSDAKQWLVKKSDEVNIAVIIDIKEDKLARRKVQMTPKAQERLRNLIAEYGTEEARLRDDIDSQPEVDSGDEMYGEVESVINVDDWVGPLSVSLEIWELNGQTPQQRGPTYAILPRPHQRIHPTISIMDMIPKSERAKFTNMDTSCDLEIDMNDYRRMLRVVRLELARDRALDYIRPSSQDDDTEFLP